MKYRKSGLLLSPGVFESIYYDIVQKFEETYNIKAENLMDYQLFGFGNYERNQPNLKQLVYESTGKNINGKYLYNKYLEWRKGKSPLKFTRDFTYVYFNCLGYNNLSEYLKNSDLSEAHLAQQENTELLSETQKSDEYYIGYFQNEEGEVVVSKLIMSRYNHVVKWILGYWENGVLSQYSYVGEILFQENGMSFLFTNKKNDLDRSLFVNFSYDRRVKILPYLIGLYSGFDRDRCPVVGQVLFERVKTLEHLEEKYEKQEVDERVSKFINGKRFAISVKLIQSLDELYKHYSPGKLLNTNLSIDTNHNESIHINGSFKVYIDSSAHSICELQIENNGLTTFTKDYHIYEGHSFIAEGSYLSIQFSKCNGIPHSGHILAFVGRYKNDELSWFKGSWHCLDENIKPCTLSLIITPHDADYSLNRIQEIFSSTELLQISKV